MSQRYNSIGITQSSLSVRESTLSQSISANTSAVSRIMDADFAKEQAESVRLQILQQTATSALAQANFSPQSVLGFLG
ncbi:MAG: flagellin, partial [Balneolaceae bacterium]